MTCGRCYRRGTPKTDTIAPPNIWSVCWNFPAWSIGSTAAVCSCRCYRSGLPKRRFQVGRAKLRRSKARADRPSDRGSRCTRQRGPFYLSLRHIAEIAGGMSHVTADAGVKYLERLGIIRCVERGEAKRGGKASVYQLTIDHDGRVR